MSLFLMDLYWVKQFFAIGAWPHQYITTADSVLETYRIGGIYPDAIWYVMH